MSLPEQTNEGMDETYKADPKREWNTRASSHTRRSTSLYLLNKEEKLDCMIFKEIFKFRDA